MKRIRPEILAAIAAPHHAPDEATAGHLASALDATGIDGKGEAIAFLAQLGTESGGFRWLEEIWGPSAAQQGYEGRAGLGNTQPGDGKRFKGRGYIQITGRANYKKASEDLDIDLIANPGKAAEPRNAAKIAAWYWRTRVAPKAPNIAAKPLDDDGQRAAFTKITKLINGGTNGLADRERRFEAGLKAAGSGPVTTGSNWQRWALIGGILLVAIIIYIIAKRLKK